MKRTKPSDIVEKYIPEGEVDRAIRFWEGKGYHLITRDDRAQTGATLCRHCLGTGEFAGAECEVCGGSGETEKRRKQKTETISERTARKIVARRKGRRTR